MIHAQVSHSQLKSIATQVMMGMTTEAVWRDGEIKGQSGKWQQEEMVLIWEQVNGIDILIKIITGSHVFTIQ